MGGGGTFRGMDGDENLKINVWPKVHYYKQVHLFDYVNYVNGRKFTTLLSVYSKRECKSPYFVGQRLCKPFSKENLENRF